MKPKKLLIVLIIGTTFLAGILFPTVSPAGLQTKNQLTREFGIFFDVIGLVKSEYVDEVSSSKLLSGALAGMLRNLDPYSQYLDADAYAELKADTEGKFGGIGIEVGIRNGFLRVISPLDGSPAEKAGILPGDIIMKINDAPARDTTLAESARRMRGEPGTIVKLALMRESDQKIIEVSVTREMIKVQSVKEAKMIDAETGYLRLSAFQENTAVEFQKALDGLLAQGMKGLILDLRNNSGGVFHSAVESAELFVPNGKVVVTTRAKNREKNREFISNSGKYRLIQPMVVLVNKGSASGSEILTGALQDHKLARVIGSKTYGKGCVQTLTPLSDHSAVRMTTSRYYTPNGRLIHEIGIEPDDAVEAIPGKDAPLERAIEWLKTS